MDSSFSLHTSLYALIAFSRLSQGSSNKFCRVFAHPSATLHALNLYVSPLLDHIHLFPSLAYCLLEDLGLCFFIQLSWLVLPF